MIGHRIAHVMFWLAHVMFWLALSGLLDPMAALAQGETPEERGRAIFEELDRRETGFGDFTATLDMVLFDRQGRESRRQMRNRTLEGQDGGDKILILFDEPRDVKGTALLIYSHPDGDDDVWLYLPALERVKRISGSNRSGPFMGSEFAYEDLSSDEIGKYTYRYLRDDTHGERPVFVVERMPKDTRSGYSKQIVWVDQERYTVSTIEYYDRKGAHLKTLEQRDFQQYADRFWRPGNLRMVNHLTDKVSELLWSDYTFQNGLDARDFDRASLARAK